MQNDLPLDKASQDKNQNNENKRKEELKLSQ